MSQKWMVQDFVTRFALRVIIKTYAYIWLIIHTQKKKKKYLFFIFIFIFKFFLPRFNRKESPHNWIQTLSSVYCSQTSYTSRPQNQIPFHSYNTLQTFSIKGILFQLSRLLYIKSHFVLILFKYLKIAYKHY